MSTGDLRRLQAWLSVLSAVLFLWIILKEGGPKG
jgi:hypothetical protein